MIRWSAMWCTSRSSTISNPPGICPAGWVLRKGYELSAREAQQQRAAEDERDRGRGSPEAHGGESERAHGAKDNGNSPLMQPRKHKSRAAKAWKRNGEVRSRQCDADVRRFCTA